MNTVTFPLFNLTLHIKKIAFTIFGIDIYWYAILIVSAMAIAILMYKKRDGLYGIKFNSIIDLLIILIPISLVFARIYFVIFNLNYYLSDPIQILNIRNGGMAIYGGIIGGTITCYAFCKKKKIDILNLMDYLAPALVLGQAIGRWGNFINIEAYGEKTNLPWRMGIYEMGEYIEVHPTFLYESLACFAIFTILLIMKNKRKFKGQITCTYLLLYSLERFFVEALRTDSLYFKGIRISQLLSGLIFIITAVILVVRIIYKPEKNSKINKNKMS